MRHSFERVMIIFSERGSAGLYFGWGEVDGIVWDIILGGWR